MARFHQNISNRTKVISLLVKSPAVFWQFKNATQQKVTKTQFNYSGQYLGQKWWWWFSARRQVHWLYAPGDEMSEVVSRCLPHRQWWVSNLPKVAPQEFAPLRPTRASLRYLNLWMSTPSPGLEPQSVATNSCNTNAWTREMYLCVL